ncbi:MAG: hypothetical protein KGL39_60235 [Patescibacteria group bacterium]|nr:hypothetical protein [Patescibacteria group bacterium]
MKLISKLALKFNKLKGDPRYAAGFMLVVLLWYLWDLENQKTIMGEIDEHSA